MIGKISCILLNSTMFLQSQSYHGFLFAYREKPLSIIIILQSLGCACNPSLADRLGVDPADFTNTIEGFKNFTSAAQNVIKNASSARTVGDKTLYFVEGAQNAKKGVAVIVRDGNIQTMMPTTLKDFLKLQ